MTVITLAASSSKAVSSNINVNDCQYDNIVPTFEYAGSLISPKAVLLLTVVAAFVMAVFIGLGFRGSL